MLKANSKNTERIVLDLTDGLSTPFLELLSKCNLKIIKKATIDTALSYIIVKNHIGTFKRLDQLYSIVDNGISLISLSEVENKVDFISAGGKGYFFEEALKVYETSLLIERFFLGTSSLSLFELLQSPNANIGLCKLTGHLNVGHYSDIISAKVFDAGFNIISIRNYFVNIVSYLAYLQKSTIAEYPFEIEYGILKDSVLIQVTVNVKNFVMEYLTEAFSDYDSSTPLKGLLRSCMDLADFFDIYYLENNNKLVVSGLWAKGILKKNELKFPSFLLNNIDSFSYVEKKFKEEFLAPVLALDDTSPEKKKDLEAKGLPGKNIGPLVLENKPMAQRLTQVIELIEKIEEVRKLEETPKEAALLSEKDLESYLKKVEGETGELKSSDKELLLQCLISPDVSQKIKESVQESKEKVLENTQTRDLFASVVVDNFAKIAKEDIFDLVDLPKDVVPGNDNEVVSGDYTDDDHIEQINSSIDAEGENREHFIGNKDDVQEIVSVGSTPDTSDKDDDVIRTFDHTEDVQEVVVVPGRAGSDSKETLTISNNTKGSEEEVIVKGSNEKEKEANIKISGTSAEIDDVIKVKGSKENQQEETIKISGMTQSQKDVDIRIKGSGSKIENDVNVRISGGASNQTDDKGSFNIKVVGTKKDTIKDETTVVKGGRALEASQKQQEIAVSWKQKAPAIMEQVSKKMESLKESGISADIASKEILHIIKTEIPVDDEMGKKLVQKVMGTAVDAVAAKVIEEKIIPKETEKSLSSNVEELRLKNELHKKDLQIKELKKLVDALKIEKEASGKVNNIISKLSIAQNSESISKVLELKTKAPESTMNASTESLDLKRSVMVQEKVASEVPVIEIKDVPIESVKEDQVIKEVVKNSSYTTDSKSEHRQSVDKQPDVVLSRGESKNNEADKIHIFAADKKAEDVVVVKKTEEVKNVNLQKSRLLDADKVVIQATPKKEFVINNKISDSVGAQDVIKREDIGITENITKKELPSVAKVSNVNPDSLNEEKSVASGKQDHLTDPRAFLEQQSEGKSETRKSESSPSLLNQQVIDLMNDVALLKSELDKAYKQVQSKEFIVNKLKEQEVTSRERTTAEIQSLKNKISDLMSKTSDEALEKVEFAKLQDKNKNLNSMLEVSNRKIATMTETINSLKDGSSSKNSLEVAHLKDTNKRHVEKITKLQTDNSKLSAKLKQIENGFKSVKTKFENEMKALRDKNDSLAKKLDVYTSSESGVVRGDTKNNLSGDSKKLHEELKNHKSQLEIANLKVKELTHKLKLAESQAVSSAKTEEREFSKGQEEKLEFKIKQMEKMHLKAEEANKKTIADLNERKKEVQKLKSEATVMKNKISELERKLAKYEKNKAA